MSRQYVQHEEPLTLHLIPDPTSTLTPSTYPQPRLQLTASMAQGIPDLEPAGERVIQLSPIDQIQPRGYIRLILCFPLNDSASTSLLSHSLDIALNTTLYYWPIFGGTVALSTDCQQLGRLEVRYSTPPSHVKFHLKHLTLEEFPHTYGGLDKAGMPLSPLDENLLCSVPAAPQSADPVPAVLAQANFISGGLLMSICLHHAVTDGKGAFLFISALADACRSGFKATIPRMDPTSYLRAGIFHDSLGGPPDLHIAYKSIEQASATANGASSEDSEVIYTNRLFTFSNASLKQLKQTVIDQLLDPINDWVSTNDCLGALLWTTIARAQLPNLHNPKTSSIAVAVDVRGRARPPLSPTYAGSAVVHSIATSEISALTSSDGPSPSQLAPLALSIRKSLHAVDSEHICQTVSLSKAFHDVRDFGFKIVPIHAHGADLILTSWRDFPYYELDFGDLGKPQWARKPWSRHAASIVVLPRDESIDKDSDEKGIEVVLLLREDDMHRLVGDLEFMKWVRRVVE
jgi:hypothetical protein